MSFFEETNDEEKPEIRGEDGYVVSIDLTNKYLGIKHKVIVGIYTNLELADKAGHKAYYKFIGRNDIHVSYSKCEKFSINYLSDIDNNFKEASKYI